MCSPSSTKEKIVFIISTLMLIQKRRGEFYPPPPPYQHYINDRMMHIFSHLTQILQESKDNTHNLPQAHYRLLVSRHRFLYLESAAAHRRTERHLMIGLLKSHVTIFSSSLFINLVVILMIKVTNA